VHLYVHVPFCARRCSYCDFSIAVRRDTPDAAYVAAISAEWRRRTEHGEVIEPLRTIYFGGGTPSRLMPASLATLLEVFRRDAGTTPDVEITIEVNPDDVDAARARAWVAAGINRVSLGVQSHDPAVLSWMHRTHQAEQVAPAIAALRDAGIENISLDLIFAVPVELQRDWRRDLDLTIALAPTHISLYGLTIEPHTPLGRWTTRGESIATPDDRYADEYLLAHAMLGSAGFRFYEVSNAARDGVVSRHNAAYWTGAEYLGLGPSAHSFQGGIRRWNVRDWAEYQRRMEAGAAFVAGEEVLDEVANDLERRYLGLRTDAGVIGSDLAPGEAERWIGAGWATADETRIRLTPEGWLRLYALVATARDS
jgi:oxygen-independent coproporphyrinogen-3 oxidase